MTWKKGGRGHIELNVYWNRRGRLRKESDTARIPRSRQELVSSDANHHEQNRKADDGSCSQENGSEGAGGPRRRSTHTRDIRKGVIQVVDELLTGSKPVF